MQSFDEQLNEIEKKVNHINDNLNKDNLVECTQELEIIGKQLEKLYNEIPDSLLERFNSIDDNWNAVKLRVNLVNKNQNIDKHLNLLLDRSTVSDLEKTSLEDIIKDTESCQNDITMFKSWIDSKGANLSEQSKNTLSSDIDKTKALLQKLTSKIDFEKKHVALSTDKRNITNTALKSHIQYIDKLILASKSPTRDINKLNKSVREITLVVQNIKKTMAANPNNKNPSNKQKLNELIERLLILNTNINAPIPTQQQEATKSQPKENTSGSGPSWPKEAANVAVKEVQTQARTVIPKPDRGETPKA